MITKELALTLPYNATLHHKTKKNKDGSPVRCRINGKVKIWKTRPNDFKLPVKYGLYECFYIDNIFYKNFDEWEFKPNGN